MSLVTKLIRYGKKRYVEYKYKKAHDYCANVFRMRLIKNNIPVDEPAPGENEYVKFWQQFHKRVEPYTYRYFHRLLNNDPRIIPEDIANRYIEPVLNPIRYSGFYSDKNTYRFYIQPKEAIPFAWCYRSLGGSMYSMTDNGVKAISFDLTAVQLASIVDVSVKKLVLKPSVNSNSGRGVLLFTRDNDVFTTSDGGELSGSFLKSYGNDFVLQEALTQHPYLQQFSTTSINTMRIMTYRSVVDDSISVIAACLRVGNNGSFVDNLFAGGCFVPIDIRNGKLDKVLYNRFWQTTTMMNGVDFAASCYMLPFWKIASEFAKCVATQVPYARLLAQDILVDVNNCPRLIEFNVDNFDWAMAMACTRDVPFGEKFDEVIAYCLQHK